MNTHAAAKTILCFGDSNTFGQRSDDVTKGRWPADVRWTGQLQTLLGESYAVIEEGLSGRTTDLDDARRQGCNGRAYLVPCLQSHNPIDGIVLMLGTNDLKAEFGRTSSAIAHAVDGLVDTIKHSAQASEDAPRIIIVSPMPIDASAEDFAALYARNYSAAAVEQSHQLAEALRAVAKKRDCLFFDAARIAVPGADGVHLSKASHTALAQGLAAQIIACFA